MEVIIEDSPQAACENAARLVARVVFEKPTAVLGLATGSTPQVLYKELIRLHEYEGLDFKRVTTFNLDEYVGLGKDHPQSYHTFMWENLISKINIEPQNVNIPDGVTEDIPRFCTGYEKAIEDAGGIDLQILGIGADGHVGFNEPTSSFASRTRIKTLTQKTVEDNARFFDGDRSLVPRHCITMGIGTIMDARMNVMLAFGKEKADAVAGAVEGPVSAMVPASILQHHQCVKVIIDNPAASRLKLKDYYHWVYDAKPKWQV